MNVKTREYKRSETLESRKQIDNWQHSVPLLGFKGIKGRLK